MSHFGEQNKKLKIEGPIMLQVWYLLLTDKTVDNVSFLCIFCASLKRICALINYFKMGENLIVQL